MAEKILTEAEWKKFSKSRDLKDANLLKALTALDKAKTPDDQLKAIATIDKELEALKKLAKSDKEVVSQLDDMAKALAKEEKNAKAAAKEAEASEDEEEESPVLLTTKMIPLLRQVKKGEEMQVLLARGGKEVAVLLSRRAISPARRKLMTEYLDDGTPKFHKGTCIWEENAYTFVLETQAAGLAKKVKAALLKQVELRLKVRVRGEDPADIDDDGEPAEIEGDEDEGSEASSSTTAQQATTPPAPAPQADPAEAEFQRRWAAMQPLVQRLIQSGAGDANKLRAVADFVGQKGDAGAFKAALQGMDSLQKLIEAAQQSAPAPTAAPTAAPTPAPTAPTEDRGKAFNARLGALLPAIKGVTGEAATPIKLKAAEAGKLAAARDFDAANAALDELEAQLERAKNAPTTASNETASQNDAEQEQDGDEDENEGEDPAQDEEEQGAGLDVAALRDRHTQIGMQMREIEGTEVHAELKALFDAATRALRSEDWATVSDRLDDIEPDLIEGLSEARALLSQPGGVSLAAVAKVSLAWRANCERAHGEVQALKDAVMADMQEEDEFDEEEMDETRAELDRLDTVFEGLNPRISQLIEMAIASAADQRRATLAQVAKLIDQAERDIQGNEMFGALRENGLRDTDLAGPGLALLGQLRTALQPLLAA